MDTVSVLSMYNEIVLVIITSILLGLYKEILIKISKYIVNMKNNKGIKDV